MRCDYPVRLKVCADMPYNTTLLPPILQHSVSHTNNLNMDVIAEEAVSCYHHAVFVLCAAVLPTCDYKHERLYPCRHLCLGKSATYVNLKLYMGKFTVSCPISKFSFNTLFLYIIMYTVLF